MKKGFIDMASMVILRTIALILWLTACADAALNLRKKHGTDLVARALARATPKHRLRVCNAYPYQTQLNVYIGKTKITDTGMTYKTCREFEPQLHAGDRIDFRFQAASAGTFVVKDLPNTDAVLMLVIYRHSAKNTAVAFESHVFANLLNAQVAVLDTYRGSEKASMKIQDKEDADTTRSEDLTPNSVVALNAGSYEVVLYGSDGAPKARSDFNVVNRESCVVIRTGIEPEQGRAYPQELIVYPALPPPSPSSSLSEESAAGGESWTGVMFHKQTWAIIVSVSFGAVVIAAFAVFTLS